MDCNLNASVNFADFFRGGVGDLGKLIVAKGFKKLPNDQQIDQIWSHCLQVHCSCNGK